MKIFSLNNKGFSLTSILITLIILLLGVIIFKALQKPREIKLTNQIVEPNTKPGLPRPIIKLKKKPEQKRNVELPDNFIW